MIKKSIICLTPKRNQSFFVYSVKRKEKMFLQKVSFLRQTESKELDKNPKEGFLTALATGIKKGSTTSIRKHVNELKVHEKTMRTAIKQDLSPDFNPLHYAIWGVLENKANVTSYLNIGSLKTALEKEWNKMSEKIILEVCKSFRSHVDRIIEKMVARLSKFTVLCLSSYFMVNFQKLKLIPFYNTVVYSCCIVERKRYTVK